MAFKNTPRDAGGTRTREAAGGPRGESPRGWRRQTVPLTHHTLAALFFPRVQCRLTRISRVSQECGAANPGLFRGGRPGGFPYGSGRGRQLVVCHGRPTRATYAHMRRRRRRRNLCARAQSSAERCGDQQVVSSSVGRGGSTLVGQRRGVVTAWRRHQHHHAADPAVGRRSRSAAMLATPHRCSLPFPRQPTPLRIPPPLFDPASLFFIPACRVSRGSATCYPALDRYPRETRLLSCPPAEYGGRAQDDHGSLGRIESRGGTSS